VRNLPEVPSLSQVWTVEDLEQLSCTVSGSYEKLIVRRPVVRQPPSLALESRGSWSGEGTCQVAEQLPGIMVHFVKAIVDRDDSAGSIRSGCWDDAKRSLMEGQS
jgi:hypothetical protein